MGFYHGWAWSWPLNRRVMYNRASADLNGKAWDPTRPGIEWDAADKKWKGDVPDYPPTMDPKDPKRWGSFGDRKSTRLNSSHRTISYAVFCLKKKKKKKQTRAQW